MDFEKLGVFYLGRSYDIETQQSGENLTLYDSRDLLTHAVCVGMTGSGKTGLCVALIEEAAIDGIPAIVIDPKGDLANLLLTFPGLSQEEFLPWVNEEEARRKGLSASDFAAKQAELWRNGLAKWGQDGERVRMLKEAADWAIYTPGSSAGLPVSVLRSFAPPSPGVAGDAELVRERISATVSALLGLVGVQADPVQSREHILLAEILGRAWSQGQELDLAGIIRQVQSPPVERIGVLELETFYPAKERFGLAMLLNNLLASPEFSAWTEGESLDLNNLLYTEEGKPRVAIFSIAHLSDSQRMFFVSLLLNETLSWTRAQSGTTSLRAIVYMDEIFGYFPPVANPPSKAPLLTLLKQARAFGVGIVLATQNPVDLDYRGLANAGTWFLGRLQTERDKARVLEGLEGAAASAGSRFNRQRMEKLLAALGSRVFLLNNVHEDAPETFQTRWVMSYLRGPLTRPQIQELMADRKTGAAKPAAPSAQAAPRPSLAPGIPQVWLPARAGAGTLFYQPMLLASAEVRFEDTKLGVDHARRILRLAPFGGDLAPVNWDASQACPLDFEELEKEAPETAGYGRLPSAAADARSYKTWEKDFASWLYANERLELSRVKELNLTSQTDESLRDFRIRLRQAAHEERDRRVEELRKKYAPKLAAQEEWIRKAEQKLEREQEQAKQQKLQAVISVGANLLSAFLGRKKLSATNLGRATTAARTVGRAHRESQDVDRAEENIEALREKLAELDSEFKAESEAVATEMEALLEQVEIKSVRPKKTNISVKLVALAWTPHWRDEAGNLTPGWE